MIRFQPGPIFSGNPSDYWAPLNWLTLRPATTGIWRLGPITGGRAGGDALPSHRAMGKDGYAHLLNRDNLGGISAPIAEAQVASSFIIWRAGHLPNTQGTYVAFRASSRHTQDFPHYCNQSTYHRQWMECEPPWTGCGSPFVTSTDGTNNMIVWVVGTGDRLVPGATSAYMVTTEIRVLLFMPVAAPTN